MRYREVHSFLLTKQEVYKTLPVAAATEGIRNRRTY